MGKKNKKKANDKLQGLGIKALESAMKGIDITGVAVVVLSNDGEIMIGSEGLDRDTCQSLLAQSADLMLAESGMSPTLH